MKRSQLRNTIFLVCVILLLIPACHKAPKIRPQVKNVNVEIRALKARVFEVASVSFIKRGFTISVANDSLGLITTDFKRVDEGLQDAFFNSFLWGKVRPEVQFGTTVIESNGISTLTIVAKGRTWHKKRGYEDYIFNDEFMNNVRKIGEEIKATAEGK